MNKELEKIFPLLGGKKLTAKEWLNLFGVSYKAEKRKSYGTRKRTNKTR